MWRCEITGAPAGPLAGQRFGVKDHISVSGIPQAFNSQPLAEFVPDVDATVVTRLLAAGGTICGKNTMSGFLDDFEMPLNPHDHRRTPGGSSSGSAGAVAAGDIDVSIGGDQGGSIRIPAAFCGVVGLKPTYGLVSHFGVTFGFEPTLDHIGPIGRRVEDLAQTLDVTAGYDGLDPRQSREVPESVNTVSGLDRGVSGLRIGVVTESFDDPIDPRVTAAVWTAMKRACGRGRGGGTGVNSRTPPVRRCVRRSGDRRNQGGFGLRFVRDRPPGLLPGVLRRGDRQDVAGAQ